MAAKQKTVMADEPVWRYLMEHRGAGSVSDLIQKLINEHESKKADIPGLGPEEPGKTDTQGLSQ